ncbi:MAG: outer membrane beta-barrel protein [Gemmatimonadetes bacterium]|uniref:Outer membrane beta-barrel protein n=1 Tax=Candidatus Kutchimonas denitrificans TaxID=3056748 RepID=A0AAE4Z9Z6_9BACT|nr:outer membrane beta-barrel protein [Gemmatimonadota bacterium]NIR76039.1 outer membrane beta-barrel protein [Candidatus Kutchimonas denitrificans]NIS02231.1 outer membrane beta-barrel protein [Gemmatimonadota bacterium]NIT68057.1 outer membrane beta-barrel protein [Gemmatimonadota bacterium]NIU54083.1 outer membrane beta-barrel protein [Gemmatimonadota bacterium]
MRQTGQYILVALLLAVGGRPVLAQGTPFSLTPYAGVYFPAADLVGNQPVPNPGPLDPETFTIRQNSGFIFGLRASRGLTEKLWIEAEAQYAFSDADAAATRREPFPQGPEQTLDAYVIAVGANVLWEAFRAPFTPFAIHLLGGVGLVTRGGEFYDEGGTYFSESLDGGTDLGLILGLGLRYELSPRLGIRADVRDYLYSHTGSVSNGEFEAETQNDIWITGGLEFRL